MTLEKLKSRYPHIDFVTVLAYMPTNCCIKNSIYPEGLEKSPLRFAIYNRNLWMLKHSDTVVSYVTHISAGAYKFYTLAKKKNLRVINLAEFTE